MRNFNFSKTLIKESGLSVYFSVTFILAKFIDFNSSCQRVKADLCLHPFCL